jgi:hypothetical protein
MKAISSFILATIQELMVVEFPLKVKIPETPTGNESFPIP